LGPLRLLALAVRRELGPAHDPATLGGNDAKDEASDPDAEGAAMQLVRGGGYAAGKGKGAAEDDDDDDEPADEEDNDDAGGGKKPTKKRAKKSKAGFGSGGKKSGARAMVTVVAEVVVATLETALSDVEYVLAAAKRWPKPTAAAHKTEATGGGGDGDADAAAAADDDDGGGGGEGAFGGRRLDPVAEQTERACARLLAVVLALQPLVKAKLPPGKYLERLFGASRRVYEAVGRVVQLLVAHKATRLGPCAKALLAQLAHAFTPAVFGCVQFTLEASAADRAQLAKQGKLVPLLVERIEQVDQHLVTLAKACAKTDAVECYIKRTTARDFKINARAYEEARAAGAERLAEKKRKQVAVGASGKTGKSTQAKKRAKGAGGAEDEEEEEEESEEEESEEDGE
jgi:hypothetical protein